MVSASRRQGAGCTRRCLVSVVGGLVGLAAWGCQSYERRPLDLPGHLVEFLARTPEQAEVGAFSERFTAGGTGGGVVFDPSDGLTCAEAEVIAVVFNGDLRVARLRAGVARASAEHAGLWEDPTINIDLSRAIESTPDAWKTFASVGLTVPVSGRLRVEKQRAGVEHAAELARVAEREWAVRMSVRRAWSEWSALEAQVGVTREFLSRMDQVLAVIDMMERAGEVGRAEARLFRIDRATRSADLAGLDSRRREAELRLRELMGLAPDAPLALRGGGLTRHVVSVPVEIGDIECRSPVVLVAVAEYEASEKSLELEVRKQYPDLHFGPGFGSEDGEDQVLLGLSAAIPVFNGNRRGVAEARAAREVARAAAEVALERTIGAVRAAGVRLEVAAARRAVLETEVVPLVDAQYEDVRRVAGLGEVNSMVLLESLARQLEVKVALVEAARDEAVAAVDVEELVGPAVEETETP